MVPICVCILSMVPLPMDVHLHLETTVLHLFLERPFPAYSRHIFFRGYHIVATEENSAQRSYYLFHFIHRIIICRSMQFAKRVAEQLLFLYLFLTILVSSCMHLLGMQQVSKTGF
mmetsp:Transcript_36274/g.60565  ORF Transcript_36274/g.60565 Transcript_36274/m.60565 type:complete len:115 (-) Transcript_36274:90-434(-)